MSTPSEEEEIMEYIYNIWRDIEEIKKDIYNLWDAVRELERRITYHRHEPY